MRRRFRWIVVGGVLGFALVGPATAGAATITPTTTADDWTPIPPYAQCSFREAVISANNDADFGGCVSTNGNYGADTVKLGPGPYTLVANAADTAGPDPAQGDVDTTGTLVIEGAGST